ncbi:Hsp20/alpha crystallin family protein [Mycoplana ramosa]|uniref:Hsp20/alpha crystallin family protein n=1 Tax=Mycoplana ramosa TaxID=40837 RepID=A0ABW3YWG6_MYCRA
MVRRSLMPFSGTSMTNDPFFSLQQGMNRLFDEVFQGTRSPIAEREQGMLMPRINVSETENQIRVTAELPGVAEEDVDITLDDDLLTIRGEKRTEAKEEKENYHFVERSFGQFQRSIRVPHSINPDDVHADMTNGVLTITLPKNAAQEQTRRIKVGSGSGSGTTISH